jgi:hypothetical protein
MMKIKNYFQFLLENQKESELTVPLQFSKRFLDVLGNPGFGIISPIKDAFIDLRLTPQQLSLVDIGKEPDTATFTTVQKLSTHFKTTDQSMLNTLIKPLTREDALVYHINRVEIRIGRLIKKLFHDTFSDVEIEKFVNQYKSILDQTALDFELWRGVDIGRGYVSSNYTFTGSSSNALMNSCMNDCTDWIDFYMGCPVQLLVLLNEEGHIFGRALIWEIGKGKFLMDRVYVSFDRDYFKFIDYAKSNGWWWKAENKSGASIPYTNGKVTDWFPVEIKLNFDFDEYKDWGIPYLDTFSYCQEDKLTNYIPKDGTYYILTSTDGVYDTNNVKSVDFEEIN